MCKLERRKEKMQQRRRRKQKGSICQFSGKWYCRYYETRVEDGALVRKYLSHFLGPVEGREKHPPDGIVREAERFMSQRNHSSIPPERVTSLGDFVEHVYLPWIEQFKRPSSAKASRDLWEDHLKAATSRYRKSLRDVRTYDAQQWLDQVAAGRNLSRNTLKHIKSALSGIFTLARRQGFYDGANPVQGTAISPTAREPEETYAYSLDEVQMMLSILPEPAATVFSVAAFAGLRFGELQGVNWEDWHDGALWVSRSMWNGHVNEPKTRKSRAPVPVIKQLAARLDMHRLRAGNPQSGPMFANSIGGRLNLNNMLARVILSSLNRCAVCGLSEGRPHLKAKEPHAFVRDARYPKWRGWHAARRGLGTNLKHLGVSDTTIQAILRHSNVSVTMTYYVKPIGEDVLSGMAKLEEKFAEKTSAQTLTNSLTNSKPASGSPPETVQ
jgi:integrase